MLEGSLLGLGAVLSDVLVTRLPNASHFVIYDSAWAVARLVHAFAQGDAIVGSEPSLEVDAANYAGWLGPPDCASSFAQPSTCGAITDGIDDDDGNKAAAAAKKKKKKKKKKVAKKCKAKGKDRLACMYKTSGAKCKWSKKQSACVLKKKSKK